MLVVAEIRAYRGRESGLVFGIGWSWYGGDGLEALIGRIGGCRGYRGRGEL